MQITIITVCHNSSKYLDKYISSFLKFNKDLYTKINFIFVDNSDDKNTETKVLKLKENNFTVKFFKIKNCGFANACNFASSKTLSKYLIFCNPDLEFLSRLDFDFNNEFYWGTIKQLTKSNKMYSYDFYPEHRSIATEFIRSNIFRSIIYYLFPTIFYPVGSFLIVKNDAFKKIKKFNETFFLYYEEVDLARRLQSKFGNFSFINDVAISHTGLGSFQNNDLAFKYETESFIKYAFLIDSKIVKKRLAIYKILGIFYRPYFYRYKILKTYFEKHCNG